MGRDRGQGGDGDHHVGGVGVQKPVLVDPQAGMAEPIDQIAAPQGGLVAIEGDRVADLGSLKVGVARNRLAATGQGKLDQGGAIQSDAGAAPPQIGRAKKPQGHRYRIRFEFIDRRKMAAMDPAATAQPAERAAPFRDLDRGAKTEQILGRRLQIRFAVTSVSWSFQRLRFERGRCSTIRTWSPTLQLLASSCAM